jgi:xanthine dehydrogenase small subunit
MPSENEVITETGHIRFVLDGAVHDVAAVDPNTTLLSYLRDDLGRCGTKEGCAEGDCGACTVVVTELLAAGHLRYRPINACIALLASVDGREVLTVESLSRRDEALHPVQEALVQHHGSQCGFCTPGIVMSLFALYKQRDGLARGDVDEGLAGNLCRCTGYRPIVDAGLAMHDLGRQRAAYTRLTALPSASTTADEQMQDVLGRLGRTEGARFGGAKLDATLASIDMPVSLDAALAVLAHEPETTVIAGGTDLCLGITKSHVSFPRLVHLGRVTELQGIERTTDNIRIGAAMRLEDVYQALRGTWPSLDRLWARFASPPIRHAATLGGNIANGSPVGDSMPALMALDAELELATSRGTRRIPLCEFYTGYRSSQLEQGELIVAVHIPAPRPHQQYLVRKVAKRLDQDISSVCVALSATVHDGFIAKARLALGGMAATPTRALSTEALLGGARLTDALEESVRAALKKDFEPISDFRASAAYRMQVAGNIVLHFLWQLGAEPRSHD